MIDEDVDERLKRLRKDQLEMLLSNAEKKYSAGQQIVTVIGLFAIGVAVAVLIVVVVVLVH